VKAGIDGGARHESNQAELCQELTRLFLCKDHGGCVDPEAGRRETWIMRILITAGPTREPIDPVRFLSNRSSGKMGYALAVAGLEMGHGVTLISGPVALSAPAGATLMPVESAQDMYEAVAGHLAGHDIAIFAAAVADYRPVAVAEQKIKKDGATMTLELERTPDILGMARAVLEYPGYLVGFAAETENLTLHAQDKLMRKGCDVIVANDVSQEGIGFDSEENEVTLCLPEGETIVMPRQSKAALARELMAFIVKRALLKLEPV
jgi:phosphopantothenate-cysteine ligase/phosphopantothenoylcysteine decarboxylase/phosphopantothenate--cysteine ligase